MEKSISKFKVNWKRKVTLIANAAGYKLLKFNKDVWLDIEGSIKEL